MLTLILGAVVSLSTLPADSTADQRAFRQILDNFNQAWATRDADVFVRHFAEDADFMQAFGRYYPTRETTREFIRFFFSKQTEALKTRELGVRTRVVAPGIVFLEQEIEGYGVRNADGTEQPPRKGELMLVLRKRSARWEIVSYRYLDIHGGPIRKDPTAAGVSDIAPPENGEDVIRAMHARYAGKWYRTLSFVQRAIFADGRPEEEWWEAAVIPGGLRIDIAPVDSGNAFLYRGDSTFSFNRRKLVHGAIGHNILEILAFDDNQPPERTIELAKGEKFDLSRLREDAWKGAAMWVIGAPGSELWIEKDRLILLRVVEPGQGGSSSDISFDKVVKLGQGWLGTEVLFLRDGKPFFHEIYRDWKIDPAVNMSLFDTPTWQRAAWIAQPQSR